ncbi:Paf1/RNA polymerase II complex component LEO1 [Besnoitia besnoiti]|uniref:Paf1/RNA polymerase II complex component LEO1 n=1 Tax=Besnoitia besnoiti TaxID=94643 RepID=A0A2A9MEU0_BESBE|nr:Paf1/RNA polymerase II complex component LEO1 [Besnoitia besnoiti]PFH34781.1 Paf1/RNA polymerase II complex component LEO1 [Besnoitia besnoiti]
MQGMDTEEGSSAEMLGAGGDSPVATADEESAPQESAAAGFHETPQDASDPGAGALSESEGEREEGDLGEVSPPAGRQEDVAADDDLFGEQEDDLFGDKDDDEAEARGQPHKTEEEVGEGCRAAERSDDGYEQPRREEDAAYSYFDGGRDDEDRMQDDRGDSENREEMEEDQELQMPYQDLPTLSKDAKVVVLRLPPTVSVKVHGAPSGAGPSSSRRSSRLGSINADDKFTIEWGLPPAKKGEDEPTAAGCEEESGELPSNCRLVEWDNGSYSLFVGSQMFDVQVKHDPTFFFENSSADGVKTYHCRADARFQVRLGELLNFREFFTQRNMRYGKKRRAALTTQEQIEHAEQATRKTVERRDVAARLRRRQAEAARGAERGLTRHFLEADSDEDEHPDEQKERDEEDGSSLAKIKEQYKRQKRYK